MAIYGAFDISGSGLVAQRTRMDAISANLTRTCGRRPDSEAIEVRSPATPGTRSDLGVHVASIDRVASFSGEFVQLPASDRGSKADLADGIEDGRHRYPNISYEKSMVERHRDQPVLRGEHSGHRGHSVDD